MSRTARLLDLMQALRRHRRPVTAAVLAGELSVSLRTIYRDVATLQGQGVTIEGEAGLGYVLGAGTFLPPLMFEDDELDAVLLGLRFVMMRGGDDPVDAEDEEAGEGLARAAADALAKIEAVLPPPQADARQITGLLVGRARRAMPHLPVLRAAMKAEQRLRLDYADKKDAATSRVVWPVAIAVFEGAEVLAAWCELREDFRHFRLDRIKAVASTGQPFPRRHRLLLADWRSKQGLDAIF